MLACLDGGFDMIGSESWRCGQNHQIDPRVNHLLKGIQPDEDFFRGNIGHRAIFFVLLKPIQTAFGPIFKSVADGNKFQAGVGIETILNGSAAPTAGNRSDQP